MNRNKRQSITGRLALSAAGALLALGAVSASAADDFDAALAEIEQRWAEANYRHDGKPQKQAFEALLEDARHLADRHPRRAEALIWRGIVASSYAGVKGPFGALSLAKEAREALKAAEAIDASALDGSAYTSLGALYYKVPGGLIGFGDKDLARAYLTKALELNPDGIDPNYFYGEFLYEQKEYRKAREALIKAQHAAPREGRELADDGRRAEISALLARIDRELDETS